MWTKEQMAIEVVSLFKDDATINLGIGFPTIIPSVLDKDHSYTIHSENGVLGVGNAPSKNEVSPTLINAGKETITINKGASFFDSSTSFGMIRGGHIDYCVLGGMEVDTKGSLANWKIPGKKITGMGGAMDLVNGAKNVIVMMGHFNKAGISKLTKECSLPLTGSGVVNYVVTELGVFSIDKEIEKFKVVNLANDNVKEKLDEDLFIL